jgi:hypothetical protein
MAEAEKRIVERWAVGHGTVVAEVRMRNDELTGCGEQEGFKRPTWTEAVEAVEMKGMRE